MVGVFDKILKFMGINIDDDSDIINSCIGKQLYLHDKSYTYIILNGNKYTESFLCKIFNFQSFDKVDNCMSPEICEFEQDVLDFVTDALLESNFHGKIFRNLVLKISLVANSSNYVCMASINTKLKEYYSIVLEDDEWYIKHANVDELKYKNWWNFIPNINTEIPYIDEYHKTLTALKHPSVSYIKRSNVKKVLLNGK